MEVVAEIGSVHDGSFGNAMALIKLASECGATVVKFQYHIADEETTTDAPNPSFFTTENRYNYFTRTSFTPSQWKVLYEYAHEVGIKFGCSVFSSKSLYNLMESGIDVVKIPSGEVTNLPLLMEIASTSLPVHLSSGMSTWTEIEEALEVLDNIQDLTLLQCTSEYPAPPERVGLNVISEMAKRFSRSIGFSDHTPGFEFSLAAVAIGAKVIEKHFCYSRHMYGSDAFNSLEPAEFKVMTLGIRNISVALENPVDKDSIESFQEMRNVFQKSIFAARDLHEKHQIVLNDLKFLKPGSGISAANYLELVGKTTTRFIKKGSMFTWDDIE